APRESRPLQELRRTARARRRVAGSRAGGSPGPARPQRRRKDDPGPQRRRQGAAGGRKRSALGLLAGGRRGASSAGLGAAGDRAVSALVASREPVGLRPLPGPVRRGTDG